MASGALLECCLPEAFREKCKENGDSQAAIIKKAMEDYINK